MKFFTIDFETFYADDYTLHSMTTEAYVRDPRFEALMLSVRDETGALTWYPQEQLTAFFASVDWADTGIICHHAHFECLILSHHFGVYPRAIICTLSMARAVLGNHIRVGLESLAKHFGLEAKNVPYNLFKGKRWAQIDDPTRRLMGAGCIHDTELCYDLFTRMAPDFPAEEYRVLDMTVRMFSEPVAIGNAEVLGKVWAEERQRKAALLADLDVTPKDLGSDDRFCALLQAEGVEIVMKTTPKGNLKPALAKSDDFMRDLLEDDDERVQALAEARLGVKSTNQQTRAERLGWMATRGPMCVYLNYAGAGTLRWSGGDKVNWQNLKARHLEGTDIRDAIEAPPGYKFATVDKSQIECRLLNFIAGQWDIIEKFTNREDIYVGIASQFYGREITKNDKPERGTGKQLELSCGYGAGADTIVDTAKKGTYGPPVFLSAEDGLRARNLYRGTHPAVVDYWASGTYCIKMMANFQSYDWGLLQVRCDELRGRRRIILPNGAQLIYDTLQWKEEEVDPKTGEIYGSGWTVTTRKGRQKMYGAKLVENIIQALARVDLSQTMLRISNAGLRCWICTHDDVSVLVKDDQYAQPTFEWILNQMRQAPAWLPNIPLDAEGALNARYHK